MKEIKEELKIYSDNNEYDVIINHNKIEDYNINGKDYKIKILKEYGNNIFSFEINNKIITAAIDSQNGAFKILTTGFLYDLELKTKTSSILEKFIAETSLGTNKSSGVISPMPGLVVKINTEIGKNVKAGDKLIIIEAMKMENSLSCDSDGVVKSINVSEGDAVDKGKLLIEIE